MACNKQLVGNVQIRVDGEILYSEKGATIDLGGQELDGMMGGDGSFQGNFVKENKPSVVECTVNLPTGFQVDTLKSCCVTVTFECDNGLMFVQRNACQANTLKITGNEGGKVALKFIGAPAEQV